MNSSDIKTFNELFNYFTNQFNNKFFLNVINKHYQNNISIKDNQEEYKNISTIEFKNKVFCLAYALKNIGIKAKDNVAIFVDSSPFWLIFDFALHQIGAICVPIFSNISKENLNYELNDAKVSYIFIDNEEKVFDIKRDLIFITHNFSIKEKNFFNFDDIMILSKQECNNKSFISHQAHEDDILTIIYTSGNTGTPKGVMLSHKNILCQLNDINYIINLKSKETILSLLPLAHIFERTVMYYYLSKGVSIYFVDDIKNTAKLLKIVQPTMMSAVPRLIDKIFNKIQLNISLKPIFSKTIATLAFFYALKYNINKNSFLYKIFDKLVYVKLREIFGSRLVKLISGGAVLNKDTCNFFINIGINIYQGYGLSEFSPVVSTNYPNNNKIGSCGKLLKSVQIKFIKGEILVKGPSLMKGYLNQEKLTKETIDTQSWLHTGDIGYMDEEGYLFVQSRKKEIFKTSYGEWVNAVFIEQQISQNKYIEFALIFVEQKPYITALLFVDKEKYLFEKQNNTNLNIKLNINLDINKYFSSPKVLKDIDKHIRKINKKLNHWERIKKYKIITKDISIATGELTPSMKICRNKIEILYEEDINTMY